MALKLAGEIVGIKEKLCYLNYVPGLQDSGDLESATKAVTATAKQGTPDYTANLTTPALSDSRVKARNMGLRLQVTIDSFGGTPQATQLHYSVEVNGTQRISGYFTATGANYAGANLDVQAGQANVGTANEIKVYLWVDQGEVVVSLCQVWQALGAYGTTAKGALSVNHWGEAYLGGMSAYIVGTGSPTTLFVLRPETDSSWSEEQLGSGFGRVLLAGDHYFCCMSSVATSLAYFRVLAITLRDWL